MYGELISLLVCIGRNLIVYVIDVCDMCVTVSMSIIFDDVRYPIVVYRRESDLNIYT